MAFVDDLGIASKKEQAPQKVSGFVDDLQLGIVSKGEATPAALPPREEVPYEYRAMYDQDVQERKTAQQPRTLLEGQVGQVTPPRTMTVTPQAATIVASTPPPTGPLSRAARHITGRDFTVGPEISTLQEQPGIIDRLIPGFMKKTGLDPATRARAANIMALHDALKGKFAPSQIEQHYDELTKQLGLPDQPSPKELAGALMNVGIAAGAVVHPVGTAIAVGQYMGISELENWLTARLKGEPYKIGEGRELREFLPELKEPYSTLVDVGEFAAKAAPLGKMGAGDVEALIKGTDWYRKLTNRERGLIDPTIGKMASDENLSAADIRAVWKDPAKRQELLRKYAGVEPQPVKAEVKPVTKPTKAAKPVTEAPLEPFVDDLGLAEPPKAPEPEPPVVPPALRSSVIYEGEQHVGEAGDTHPDILEAQGIGREEPHDRGFITPQGETLDRKQAVDWLRENEPTTFAEWQKLVGPGATELYSEHYNEARKETEHALETGIRPENDQREYPRDGGVGSRTEAGSGGITGERPPAPAKKEEEKVTSPVHDYLQALADLKILGVDVPEEMAAPPEVSAPSVAPEEPAPVTLKENLERIKQGKLPKPMKKAEEVPPEAPTIAEKPVSPAMPAVEPSLGEIGPQTMGGLGIIEGGMPKEGVLKIRLHNAGGSGGTVEGYLDHNGNVFVDGNWYKPGDIAYWGKQEYPNKTKLHNYPHEDIIEIYRRNEGRIDYIREIYEGFKKIDKTIPYDGSPNSLRYKDVPEHLKLQVRNLESKEIGPGFSNPTIKDIDEYLLKKYLENYHEFEFGGGGYLHLTTEPRQLSPNEQKAIEAWEQKGGSLGRTALVSLGRGEETKAWGYESPKGPKEKIKLVSTAGEIVPPRGAGEAPGTVTKEPWEMTRSEFGYDENKPKYDAVVDAINAGKSIQVRTQYRVVPLTKPEHISIGKDGTVRIPEGKKMVTLTDDQVDSLAGQAGIKPVPFDEKVYHRAEVEQAFSEGKPVPPEVLKDYPELAPKSHEAEAARLGISFNGLQERGTKPPLPLFTDPQNGGTFALPEGKTLDEALAAHREKFEAAVPVSGKIRPIKPMAPKPTLMEKGPPGGWTEADKVPEKYRKKAEPVAPTPEEAPAPLPLKEEMRLRTIADEEWDDADVEPGNYPTWLARNAVARARLSQYGKGNFSKAQDDLEEAQGAWYGDHPGEPYPDEIVLAQKTIRDIRQGQADMFGLQPPVKAPLEAAPDQPSAAIADQVATYLKESKGALSPAQLFGWADSAHGGTQAEGKYTPKDAYDAMEVGINKYITDSGVDPTANAERAVTDIKLLKAAINRLPTQSKRTAETDEFQQFSTPPPLAYAANWAANITPADTVLEPSAGTGNLATFAKMAGPKEVIVNELSPRRADLLKQLGFDRVFTENAEQLNNILPKDVKPTVVVMNPPFSATAGRLQGARKTEFGALHVEQALKKLEPNGRLVAIVSRGMADDAPAFLDWWKDIKSKYNVRANIGVSGKGYTKYGTTFDNRLLIIDKTGKQADNIVTGKVENVEDLVPLVERIRDDRTGIEEAQGAQPEAREPERGEVVAPSEREPGVGPAPRPATGAVGAGEREAEGGGPARPRDAGRPPVPVEPGEGVPVPATQHLGAGEETAKAGAEALREVERTPERIAERLPESESVAVGQKKAERSHGEMTDSIYDAYKPERISIPGSKPHPGKLVQSAAMSAMLPPKPTYKPSLPQEIIKQGKLSDAQLEPVVYAGQAHSVMLPEGIRKGFFIGDGTGVGKGREIAGILWDNWNKGRKKAIWFSEKSGLSNDAKRDIEGTGWDKGHLFELGKIKAGSEIGRDQGILFSTYATLRSKEKKTEGGIDVGQTRLQQIINWFGRDYDGVIIFDEAHNMGNAVATTGERGVRQPSAMALAGLELQKELPNARVVYVSATGATEVMNLAYGSRLALWGEGKSFGNMQSFINGISGSSIAGMEMVAMNMKALGVYSSRSLSYDGVTYERITHELTEPQREIYNELARSWQLVLHNIQAALRTGGGERNGRFKSAVYSAFWGSHQRFFNQVITSMQMPTVLNKVRQDIAHGEAAVLQLVNTNEAQQERVLARMEEEDDFEDLDMTPREHLMDYIRNSFPVQQFEEYTDENGNIKSRPVVDSAGNPVLNNEAVVAREHLLDTLGSIRVPQGPLELVLDEFGHEAVAEVTGRKRRIVIDKDGKKVEQKRGRSHALADAQSFMGDKKQILMFSDAGGTGVSYHSDLTAKNQRKRNHYLVQPGWRADKAVQGMGRTHRTNEANQPNYVLCQTNLKGQMRFLSSIARRLDQLGALTKGQRQTGSQGILNSRDNLENDYARDALNMFWHDLARGAVPGISADEFESQTGLKITDDYGNLLRDLPPIRQFLNRLLSMDIDTQNHVFDAFAHRMDAIIEAHAEDGTLDQGLETIRAKRINKVSEQVVHTDEETGAETKYVEIDVTNPADKVSFADSDRYGRGGYYRNVKSQKMWASSSERQRTTRSGDVESYVALTSPNHHIQRINTDVLSDDERWEKIPDKTIAKGLWNNDLNQIPNEITDRQHLITGALLPIWDRLSGHARVVRVQTEAGERMLGRLINPQDLQGTLARLGASSSAIKVPGSEIASNILDSGYRITLSNDWSIKRSTVSGNQRIEIEGPDWTNTEELTRHGVFMERIAYKTRYFIPTDERAGKIIEALTKNRPIITMTHGRTVDTTLYSGIDPTQTLNVLRGLRDNIKEAMPHLEILGRRAYEDGHQRFDAWRTRMKEVLGNLWDSFKGAIKNIWNMVSKPLRGERGAVEPPLSLEQQASLLRIREFAKRAGKSMKDFLADFGVKEPESTAAQFEEPAPEPEEMRTTGIKNSVVDQERIDRGLEPMEARARKGNETTWDNAKRAVDSKERDPRLIAQELSENKRGFENEEEEAMLLYDRMRLANEYADVLDLNRRAIEDGNDALTLETQQRLATIEDALENNDKASTFGGTFAARTLQFRTRLANEDYTLAAVVMRAKKANQWKAITAELRGKLETMVKEREQAAAAYEAHLKAKDEQIAALQARRTVTKMVNEEATKPVRLKRTEDRRADLKVEFQGLVAEFNAIMQPTRLHMQIDPQAVPVLLKMARTLIEQGVNTAEGIVGEIYDNLKDDYEDLEERDIQDAISGYGKTSRPNRDEIDIQLREAKAQMRLISAYEDATAGEVPLRTGFQRDPRSDRVRELEKQVRQAMRESGIDSTSAHSPEEQWRTSLEAVKTRLRNQITDLTKQLETGEKRPKKVGITYDEEAEALRTERDRLQSAIEEIEGKPEMSPEQRIRVATQAVEKSLAEYERRIHEQDLSPKRKESKTPLTPELEALRAQRDELKAIYRDMVKEAQPKREPEEIALDAFKRRTSKKIDELTDRLAKGDFSKIPKKKLPLDHEAMSLKADLEKKKAMIDQEVRKIERANREPYEKGLDLIAKWRRFVLLSSVRTIAKLTSAATMRMMTTPIEELVGGGLSALPGISSIADMAPREGGGPNIRAEAKAFRQLWEKASFTDMWETLKTGRGSLDYLYGEKAHLPPEALDFFGHVHGFFKVIPKRAEFFRSLEKRTAWALNHGMDITDPRVQATIHAGAYLDANRAIFMQDNFATNLYRTMLSVAEKQGAVGKTVATVGRVILPIVKVPTNFVAETFNYALGVPKAGVQLASRPVINAVRAMLKKKSLDKLTPDQMDNIMRSLKKGSIGLALLAIGYYSADTVGGYYQPGQKRKPGDVKASEIRVGGVDIPQYVLHVPVIECLQMGATIRRVQDYYSARMKEHGAGAGVYTAAKGAAEQVPFLDEPIRAGQAARTAESAALGLAGIAESMAVPPDVGKVAKLMDTDEEGQPIPRKPETVGQVFEQNIPGLRGRVPVNVKAQKAQQADVEAKQWQAEGGEEPDTAENDLRKYAKRLSLDKLADQLPNATPEQARVVRPIFQERYVDLDVKGKLTPEKRERYLRALQQSAGGR